MKAILAPLLALLAAPVLAETQDDVLSARMLPGWQETGTYMAAISLSLAPGWKTYWRAPGEAGIPPVFDWSASQNLGKVALHWPSPQVITLNGMTSIGYLDRLTLPVQVTPLDPAKPVKLRLHLEIGICHDICMPAALDLTADLSGPGAPDAAIAAALKSGPLDAKAAGLTAIACDMRPIDDGMHIDAKLTLPQQAKAEAVVFETAEPDIWISEAETARDGAALTAGADFVPPAGKPFALDRSGLIVTVLAGGRSVEIHGCPAP